MQLLKLTPVAVILALVICSCKTDLSDGQVVRSGLPMSPSQVIPPNGSSATGSIDVVYNQTSHTLNYTIKWSGLTGNITGFHIHGPAFKGFPSLVGPFQSISGFQNGTSGTYSGTLYVDEVALKESDLLHGEYYVDIHTAANAAGELRGQIEFN